MRLAVWIFSCSVVIASVTRAQTATDPHLGLRVAYDPLVSTAEVSWWGTAGKSYFIQTTDDLLAPWNYLPIIESGSDAVISWGFLSSSDLSFYRIKYVDTPIGGAETYDFDADDLGTLEELNLGLDPFAALDLNGNGIPDDWEFAKDSEFAVFPSALTAELTYNSTETQSLYLSNPVVPPSDFTVSLSDSGDGSQEDYTPDDFIDVSPLSGTTPAGGNTELQVTFSSHDLLPGSYTANIDIAHSGAGASPIQISATLEVINPPTDIALTSPEAGGVYWSNESIQLEATAIDNGSGVERVVFFREDIEVYADLSAPYTYTWEDPVVGTYALTARAVDQFGGITLSDPVNITVLADTDEDRMPDSWEGDVFGSIASEASADEDFDGFPNIFEYHHGTDPTDPLSFPIFSTSQDTVSPLVIEGPVHYYIVDGVSNTQYQKSTLQSAIDAAGDFDIIEVRPGIYDENVTINKRLYIFSSEGARNTIIDGGARHDTVVYMSQESVLEGFTVQNGNTGADGGGLYFSNGSAQNKFRVVGCVIRDNRASHRGGGVCIVQGDTTFVSCTIADNYADQASGIFVASLGASVTLVNTLVWNPGDTEIAGVTANVFHNKSLIREPLSGNALLDDVDTGVSNPGIAYDLGLTATSIARNAGTAALYARQDADGELLSDGQKDIGADEFTDSDTDGLPDWLEDLAGGALVASADSDGDSLTNLEDYTSGTDPFLSDTDGDGLLDGEDPDNGSGPGGGGGNAPPPEPATSPAPSYAAIKMLDSSGITTQGITNDGSILFRQGNAWHLKKLSGGTVAIATDTIPQTNEDEVPLASLNVEAISGDGHIIGSGSYFSVSQTGAGTVVKSDTFGILWEPDNYGQPSVFHDDATHNTETGYDESVAKTYGETSSIYFSHVANGGLLGGTRSEKKLSSSRDIYSGTLGGSLTPLNTTYRSEDVVSKTFYNKSTFDNDESEVSNLYEAYHELFSSSPGIVSENRGYFAKEDYALIDMNGEDTLVSKNTGSREYVAGEFDTGLYRTRIERAYFYNATELDYQPFKLSNSGTIPDSEEIEVTWIVGRKEGRLVASIALGEGNLSQLDIDDYTATPYVSDVDGDGLVTIAAGPYVYRQDHLMDPETGALIPLLAFNRFHIAQDILNSPQDITVKGISDNGIPLLDVGSELPDAAPGLTNVLEEGYHVLLDVDLAVDYNRDGEIDDSDLQRANRSRRGEDSQRFYFWANDDNDFLDTGGSGIPGDSGADASDPITDGFVDGMGDLIDFFPVFVDFDGLEFNEGELDSLKVDFEGDHLNMLIATEGVFEGFSYENESSIHQDAQQAQNLFHASGDARGTMDESKFSVVSLRDAPSPISDLFPAMKRLLNEGKGYFFFEGREASEEPLVLTLSSAGNEIMRMELPLKISSVNDMFLHVDCLPYNGDELLGDTEVRRFNRDGRYHQTHCPGLPDDQVNDDHFVFVHGYNVNGVRNYGSQNDASLGWQAEMFKRLFWAGSNARFHGVTWFGNEGQDSRFLIGNLVGYKTEDLHINVVNAYRSAEYLSDYLRNLESSAEVSISLAGHSLGNMISCKAIKGEADSGRFGNFAGANPDYYFMLNAAIPAEAFATDRLDRTEDDNDMVHSTWGLPTAIQGDDNGYSESLRAHEWYRLFPEDDHRSNLTWRGEFSEVVDKLGNNLYNIWSARDHVFLKTLYGDDPDTLDIVVPTTWSFGVVGDATQDGVAAWVASEKGKGKGLTFGVNPNTDFNGWGLFELSTLSTYPYQIEGPGPNSVSRPEFDSIRVFGSKIIIFDKPESITLNSLIEYPFFRRNEGGYNKFPGTDFEELYSPSIGNASTGSAFASYHHAALLSESFPSMSLAAGGTSIHSFTDGRANNIEMITEYLNDGWTSESGRNSNDWLHSDLKNVAYPYVNELYVDLVEIANLDEE